MKKYRNKRNSAYADIYISAKLLSPLTLEEMEENKLLSLDMFYDLMEEAVKKGNNVYCGYDKYHYMFHRPANKKELRCFYLTGSDNIQNNRLEVNMLFEVSHYWDYPEEALELLSDFNNKYIQRLEDYGVKLEVTTNLTYIINYDDF